MTENKYLSLNQLEPGMTFIGPDRIQRKIKSVENRSKTQTVVFFEGGGSLAASPHQTVKVIA